MQAARMPTDIRATLPLTLLTEVGDEWDGPVTPIKSENERAPSPLNLSTALHSQVRFTQSQSTAKPSTANTSKLQEHRD